MGGYKLSAVRTEQAILTYRDSSKAACRGNWFANRYSRLVLGVFDMFKGILVPNRRLIYLSACLIAGIRLVRAGQVNVRVIPTSASISESIEVAEEVFNWVSREE